MTRFCMATWTPCIRKHRDAIDALANHMVIDNMLEEWRIEWTIEPLHFESQSNCGVECPKRRTMTLDDLLFD